MNIIQHNILVRRQVETDKGFEVDIDGFKKELEAQKERARSSRSDVQRMKGQNEEFLKFKAESRFSGYDCTNQQSKVIMTFGNAVVLDETPFYAFSGGQLCDKGTIDGIEVVDVVKLPTGQHLHVLKENPFTIGDMVFAEVDKNNRNSGR